MNNQISIGEIEILNINLSRIKTVIRNSFPEIIHNFPLSGITLLVYQELNTTNIEHSDSLYLVTENSIIMSFIQLIKKGL